MKQYIFFFFLIITITSVAKNDNSKTQLNGKFSWKYAYDIYANIDLREDSTFRFKWGAGLAGGKVYGIWVLKRNKIILNTTRQITPGQSTNYEILKKVRGESENTLILFVDENNNTLYPDCYCYKNETEFLIYSHSESEKNIIEKKSCDSVLVDYIGYKSVSFNIDHTLDQITIQIFPSNYRYEFFNNEKWKYRNNQIIVPYFKKFKNFGTPLYKRVKFIKKSA